MVESGSQISISEVDRRSSYVPRSEGRSPKPASFALIGALFAQTNLDSRVLSELQEALVSSSSLEDLDTTLRSRFGARGARIIRAEAASIMENPNRTAGYPRKVTNRVGRWAIQEEGTGSAVLPTTSIATTIKATDGESPPWSRRSRLAERPVGTGSYPNVGGRKGKRGGGRLR